MIIGVISAKGGVGKTTITANLGAALVSFFGKKVLVIDGNITTPSLGIHLGILSQERTLNDVLEGSIDIQQAMYIHPCGLTVVPASLDVKSEYPDMDRLAEVLTPIKNSYEFILLDGAAGIGKEVLSVIRASDNVLLVANPEMTSVLAAVKALKISRALGVPPIGVVMNKSIKEKHELSKADVEDLCESKVVGTIPYDKKVSESIRKMQPIVLYERNSPAKEAFLSLSSYLLGVEYKKESFIDRLKRMLRIVK